MAILEKETGHYYRVLFDECMVKGNNVIVTYDVYKTKADREKEGSREKGYQEYQRNMNEVLNNKYNQLVKKVEKLGLQQNDILSPTEEGKIDKDLYPELRTQQDELERLELLQNKLRQSLYQEGEKDQEPIGSIDKVLIKNGFKEEWVTDPIVKVGRASINVGIYNEELINHAFYYYRLKQYMNENIMDDWSQCSEEQK